MSYKKSTLDPALKNMGKRWSKDEDEKMLKALAKGGKGATLAELSKVFFRTENSVRYRIYGKAYGDFRLGMPTSEILKKYRLTLEEFEAQKARMEEQERVEAEKAQAIISGKNLAERSIKVRGYDNVQHLKSHLGADSGNEQEDYEEEEDGWKSNEVDDSEEGDEEEDQEEDDREDSKNKIHNIQQIKDYIDQIRKADYQKMTEMILKTKSEMEERFGALEDALNTITQHMNSMTVVIQKIQSKK